MHPLFSNFTDFMRFFSPSRKSEVIVLKEEMKADRIEVSRTPESIQVQPSVDPLPDIARTNSLYAPVNFDKNFNKKRNYFFSTTRECAQTCTRTHSSHSNPKAIKLPPRLTQLPDTTHLFTIPIERLPFRKSQHKK